MASESWKLRLSASRYLPSQTERGSPSSFSAARLTASVTLDAVPDELLKIADTGARQVVWSSLLNGMALAAVDPRLVLRTFQSAWPVEDNQSLRHWVPQLVVNAMGYYLPYEERAAARAEINTLRGNGVEPQDCAAEAAALKVKIPGVE